VLVHTETEISQGNTFGFLEMQNAVPAVTQNDLASSDEDVIQDHPDPANASGINNAQGASSVVPEQPIASASYLQQSKRSACSLHTSTLENQYSQNFLHQNKLVVSQPIAAQNIHKDPRHPTQSAKNFRQLPNQGMRTGMQQPSNQPNTHFAHQAYLQNQPNAYDPYNPPQRNQNAQRANPQQKMQPNVHLNVNMKSLPNVHMNPQLNVQGNSYQQMNVQRNSQMNMQRNPQLNVVANRNPISNIHATMQPNQRNQGSASHNYQQSFMPQNANYPGASAQSNTQMLSPQNMNPTRAITYPPPEQRQNIMPGYANYQHAQGMQPQRQFHQQPQQHHSTQQAQGHAPQGYAMSNQSHQSHIHHQRQQQQHPQHQAHLNVRRKEPNGYQNPFSGKPN